LIFITSNIINSKKKMSYPFYPPNGNRGLPNYYPQNPGYPRQPGFSPMPSYYPPPPSFPGIPFMSPQPEYFRYPYIPVPTPVYYVPYPVAPAVWEIMPQNPSDPNMNIQTSAPTPAPEPAPEPAQTKQKEPNINKTDLK
jgi:hypothetical protein